VPVSNRDSRVIVDTNALESNRDISPALIVADLRAVAQGLTERKFAALLKKDA
jgi:hypothetical protein